MKYKNGSQRKNLLRILSSSSQVQVHIHHRPRFHLLAHLTAQVQLHIQAKLFTLYLDKYLRSVPEVNYSLLNEILPIDKLECLFHQHSPTIRSSRIRRSLVLSLRTFSFCSIKTATIYIISTTYPVHNSKVHSHVEVPKCERYVSSWWSTQNVSRHCQNNSRKTHSTTAFVDKVVLSQRILILWPGRLQDDSSSQFLIFGVHGNV